MSSSSESARQAGPEGSTTPISGPVTAESVDTLFVALDQLYGRHWRHRAKEAGWGSEIEGQFVPFDADGKWLQALQHLTEAHVRSGLLALDEQAERAVAEARTAWPPDSPMMFAKACRVRPEALGWPTREAAWRSVEQNAFTGTPVEHETVLAAMTSVDKDALRVATYAELEQHRRLFLKSYEGVVNRAIAGQPIQTRAALESRENVSRAERAMRAGEEKAAALAAQQHGPGGVAGLRAALNNDGGA
ncbi:hypothetical protein [Salinicola avicenniae]|uniref:hypothetical protein n=1 Tax=Salinicola avicenniae TaxID=2916836 RepID=UPI0020741745|nr:MULTISPECIES: hypothetical protein [unclassified Salinicola]